MVKVYYGYEFMKPIGQCVSKMSNFVLLKEKKMFVCGINQYVAMISMKTGQVLHYLQKKNKNTPIRCISVHQNKVYGGFEDGEIVVWDIDTQEEVQSFDFHKKTVAAISIYQPQQKMISASMDGLIIIWDLLSEECHYIKSAHSNAITSIEVTKILYKGKPTLVVVSIAKDGFLKIWDIETQLCLTAISCHVTEALSLYIDHKSGLFYVGTNKEDIIEVQILPTKDQKPGQICQVKGIFKRKNYSKCLQIESDDNTMYVLNSEKGIETYQMLGNKNIEERVKKALNRKRKAQEGKNEQIEIEEAQYSLKLMEQKVIPFTIYNFKVNNGKIYLNNGTNILQLENNNSITNGSDRTNQLCLLHPFLVQRNPQNLNVYSLNAVNKLFSIPVKAKYCSLFNNGFILIVEHQKISIWDLAQHKEIAELKEQWSGCWAKQNKCMLWRQNQIGFFQVGYDKQKQIKIKLIGNKLFQDKVTEASFKHNMDKYVVCLQNSQVQIFYSDSHKNFLKLYGHKMPILSYDLSSDDSLLATGSIDKDIRLWDMDYGHSIKTLFAHQEPITVVKFISQTHYLLSGSKDGHVKFWDADTYELVMNFEQSLLQIKTIAVTVSGDYIFAGGLDQGFRVWRQTNQQIVASDLEDRQLQKTMIEDYATQKLSQNEEKTRYQDLKNGEEIIQALDNLQSPKLVVDLVKAIPPANLKSSLSFLHGDHVRKLEGYVELMIKNSYETETCWRIMEALERGSPLGSILMERWKGMKRLLRMNRQGLKVVMKNIEEEGSFL